MSSAEIERILSALRPHLRLGERQDVRELAHSAGVHTLDAMKALNHVEQGHDGDLLKPRPHDIG
ncbi:MAG: hypothetical protein Q7R62_03065 [bacterium]|nr:hypothetical protein [bacterium]